MFARLFLLFTVVPLVELLLLIELGRLVGPLPTLALCVSTGAIGAWLARQQGFRCVARLQEALGQGAFPGAELAAGACVLLGGALLLTPGLLTDLVGFSLLLPVTREPLLRWLQRRYQLKQGIIEVERVE